MKILVVDDEKAMTSLFQDYLELCGGHKITIALSGKEALAKIQTQKPDLIILDHMMPDLSGVEVVDQLKKSTNTADIPVVIFSVADAPTEEERKSIGVIEFLRKPINFAKLNQSSINLIYYGPCPGGAKKTPYR